ncbi:MAG: tRNA (guanosine(37)-N1)-methyltransferase TrmD [Erysipelotrichaceae bacterium]
MKISVLTLFPEFFKSGLETSIIKRAIEKELVDIELINIRDFSLDKNHKVDDTPYGGGSGMVINVSCVYDALQSVKTDNSYVVITSPIGQVYNQSKALQFANYEHLIIICGHYEGIDARIYDYVDQIISIGDFILTGGENVASCIIDSVVRLIDGVITKESLDEESFNNHLLEPYAYTRPFTFNGVSVPEVLTNGNHKLIREYKYAQSLQLTYLNRPDLLEDVELSDDDKKILHKIIEK